MSFGKRTHDLLAASDPVKAIIAGRIYPLTAPQKPGPNGTTVPADVFPAVIYTVVSDVNLLALDDDGPRNARVQIDCYAATYKAAHALADAVAGALSMNEPGFASMPQSRRDGYEDETRLYRVSMDFSQWMTEA